MCLAGEELTASRLSKVTAPLRRFQPLQMISSVLDCHTKLLKNVLAA